MQYPKDGRWYRTYANLTLPVGSLFQCLQPLLSRHDIISRYNIGGTKKAGDTAYPTQPNLATYGTNSDRYVTHSSDPMYVNNPSPYEDSTDQYVNEDTSRSQY